MQNAGKPAADVLPEIEYFNIYNLRETFKYESIWING